VMSRARALLSWIHAVLTRSRRDRDFDEELREQLALLIEEERARGLDIEEARRLALVKLGQPGRIAEDHRAWRGLPMLDVFGQDLRYAVRGLRRSPGFASVVIISLGLGIGANTALFSLIDALLLRPLPVAEPDRLVFIQRTSQSSGKRLAVDQSTLDGLCTLRGTYSDVAACVPIMQPEIAIDGTAEPGRLVMRATDNFFHVLGVGAVIGRVHMRAVGWQTTGSSAGVAVIGEGFWTRRFGRDVGVLGRTVYVDRRAYPVIGVAGPGFFGL
jgi:hypothetical protein